MNIYFYPAGTSACNIGCNYLMCHQRCLVSLQKLQALRNITVLPGGSYFATPLSRDMRCGDLMILYAANTEELTDLITNKEIFEAFRIILIVGDDACLNGGTCHVLNPRYITSMEMKVAGLNAVIEKMTGTEYQPTLEIT